VNVETIFIDLSTRTLPILNMRVKINLGNLNTLRRCSVSKELEGWRELKGIKSPTSQNPPQPPWERNKFYRKYFIITGFGPLIICVSPPILDF
jgi:hypothetical protein